MTYQDRIIASLTIRAQDGVTLLLLGLFIATVSGAVMKVLAAELPAAMIVWARFLTFSLIIAPIVVVRFGYAQAMRPVKPGLQLARGLMMILAVNDA